MKNDSISYNTQSQKSTKNFLLLDLPQVVLDFTLGLLVLLSFNIPVIWSRVTLGSDVLSYPSLGSYISDWFPWIYNFFDSPIGSRVVQMALWLFIGSVIYIIIWFITSFLTSFRNDLVADSYLHPKTYDRSDFWVSVLSRKIIFVILSLFLIVFIYASSTLLFQLSQGAYSSVVNFSAQTSIAYLLGSVLVATLTIHLLFILLKLIANSWRALYNDL